MAKKRTGRKGTRAGATPRARVVVKFHDFVDLPYVDGVEREIKKRKLAPWEALVRQFPGITLTRLFPNIRVPRLKDLIVDATRLDREYHPPNFLTYFDVVCPPKIDPVALAEAFRTWRIVQTAYVDPLDASAVLPAGTNPNLADQDYLEAAPVGIEALFAWTPPLANGAGEGQRFIDLERSFVFGHQDLPPFTNSAAGSLLFGDSDTTTSLANPGHGAAILGIVCMLDNNVGGVGIAYRLAQVDAISQWNAAAMTNNRPAAIIEAIKHFTRPGERAFGRVLLLPLQIVSSANPPLPALPVFGGGSWDYAPIEALQADFDTIRLATALGIIVVTASGNGNHDLDTYREAVTGAYHLSRTSPDFRDSGAIMVGAGNSPNIAPARARRQLSPTVGSNYGSRVDCYAWGDSVFTCGSTTTTYTSSFSGTSSASAIVAGAALSTQGMVEAKLGWRLGSRQMRAVLANPANGTASNDPPTDRIGPMPDLKKIAGALGVLPDLYLRDFVGDNGDPHAGAISTSPDIIVRPAQVMNPGAAFGPGSGTENSNTQGSTVTSGVPNYIYVRVLNRGSAAANVSVAVYWAPPATLLTPDMWTPAGNIVIPNVPAGNVLTVSNAIVWPVVPPTGHYCFVGIVGNALDPPPDPAALFDWNTYYLYIRENNNITWRNFNVV